MLYLPIHHSAGYHDNDHGSDDSKSIIKGNTDPQTILHPRRYTSQLSGSGALMSTHVNLLDDLQGNTECSRYLLPLLPQALELVSFLMWEGLYLEDYPSRGNTRMHVIW